MEPLAATYYDAKEKTWLGPKQKPLYNENITLGEVIYETLKKNPQKIIQIHEPTGEKLTCSELLKYSENLSRNLLKLGLKPGDVIGMFANNWTHVTTIMLASFLCGTPVNAIFPGFDKESSFSIYNATKPKILFCEMENIVIAQSLAEDFKIPVYVLNGEAEGVRNVRVLLSENEDQNQIADSFRFPCLNLKGDDTAVILCSSGTTGLPKGVLCSHQALLNQKIFLTLTQESVLFTFSAIYWISGLWTLIASLVNGSVRIVTTQPYTPEYFLHLIRQYKITHLMATVSQMTELVLNEHVAAQEIQKSLESIDTMIIGGAKIPAILQEKLNLLLKNHKKSPGYSLTYGMSELGGLLTTNSYPMNGLMGNVGKIMANCVVRIISKDGERLGPLEYGEICIQFPHKWQGYFNNPEATLKAQHDNWLYTGDIGYFDEQDSLHVCARDNDVFKSRNFQIYPPLIEEVILRLPGIAETCVCGIPDLVASHLTACVVVRTANEDGANLTAEKVEKHVKNTLGSMYHLSGGIYFMNSLAKTGSGKLQRHKVLEAVMKMKEQSIMKNKNSVFFT